MLGNQKKDDLNFKKIVQKYYKEHGRHDLPWRQDTSPYSIVVSEVMLQQTQVSRVVGFYNIWMKKWPDFKSLASADRIVVLSAWKGLGYNNRAVRLHELAKIITNDYKGKFPETFEDIKTLPGIGSYTAGAIMNFSYNVPTPLIETNIRRVYIHHYFENINEIHDKEILMHVSRTLPHKNPHKWFWALMDYGSHLPKITKTNSNVKSRHYTKQSVFKNSNRYFRAKILDYVVHEKNIDSEKIFEIMSNDEERAYEIITSLIRDHLLTEKDGKYVINKS